MPDTIGRYQLLDQLGEGGMAAVYKAYDPDIHRTVAIKVLHEALCENPEYRHRFLREAKAAGKLTHPHIVTIYDVAEQNGRPYIAMELLEGRSLAQIMETGARLPLAWVVRIGIQLAEALDYAHSRGIVHRDITPSNIICLPDCDTVKITDFGIAYMESAEISERTKVGTVLGTAHYMSPEQMEAVTEIDGRSDLFSVGVILYQLVTGQKPFTGDSLMAVYKEIMKNDLKPIAALAPTLPPALKKIIEKLLRKDREKRFQTGRELAAALQRVLDDVQDQEHREPRIIPLRLKWTMLMAGLVALIMVLGLVVTYRAQYAAMSRLAVEFGSSLAQLIATENAEGVLLEDWVGIQTVVEQTASQQALRYLTVIDHRRVVRGSTDAGSVGQVYPGPAAGTPLDRVKDTAIYERRLPDGDHVFHFDAPIRFQQHEIGRVQLGLTQTPLRQAARTTLWMMLALLGATVTAVVVAGYLLSARLSRPIRVVRRALGALAEGDYEQRIEEQRQDEFGLLYAAFNRAAEAIQQTHRPREVQEVPVPGVDASRPPDAGPAPRREPAAAGRSPGRRKTELEAQPPLAALPGGASPGSSQDGSTRVMDQEKITSAIRRLERLEPPED